MYLSIFLALLVSIFVTYSFTYHFNSLLVIPIFLVLFAFITGLLCVFLYYYRRLVAIDSEAQGLNYKKLFFVYLGLILVAWLPYFIIFFPGNASPDSIDQWAQATGVIKLSNHHPVFHTLIIRLSTFISGDRSPWAYSLMQMLLMSSAMAFVVTWLRKKGLKKYFVWLVLAFFALHPINGMYSITMWKDVLFSGSVMILTLAIAEIVLSRGKSLLSNFYFWLFSISAVCVANLRSNGALVAVLSLFFILILFKKYRKKLAIALMIVLSSIVIRSVVVAALDVPNPKIRESLAIPIQQVSRVVVASGKISKSDVKLISKVMPIDEIKLSYANNTVDPVKFNPNFNNDELENNKFDYLKLWFRIMLENPKLYIKAYLDETRGYWDPMAYNWSIFYGIEKDNFNLMDLDNSNSVQEKYAIKFIEKTQSLIAFKPFWSGAIYNYVMIFMLIAMFYVSKRKKWLYLLVATPFLLNWLTLLIATPTANNARYIYCSFLVSPIVIFLSIYNNKSVKKPSI